jgi:hypothetical protein
LLVAKLAIVHQAADRRRGVGRHFHKIQFTFFGEALGLLDADDANLCPVLIDEPYFTGTDTVVDAKPISNCITPLVYVCNQGYTWAQRVPGLLAAVALYQ